MSDRDLFREFEHTGDIGIEVEAPDRTGLFARAALALGRLMVAPEGIAPKDTRVVEIESKAGNDDDLMHDMLSAALNVFLADSFIWVETRAEEIANGIAVTLRGEPFDPQRHQFLTEIKAVTYHELKVERADGDWRARIIFDV